MKIKKAWTKILLLVVGVCFLIALSSCTYSEVEETTITETGCKHDFEEWIVIEEPTCVKGSQKRTCKLCQELEKEDIDPIEEHEYGEWKLVKEADCETGEITQAKCENCDHIEKRTDDKKGFHNYVDFKCSICLKEASKGLEYELSSNGKYYILANVGNCNDSAIVLVDLYNKIPVTTIGEGAFYGCTSIKEIYFPETVTTIEEKAFSNCISLTKITIPVTINKIGKAAFEDCHNITSITLPFVGNEVEGKENTHFGYIFGADNFTENNLYIPKKLQEVKVDGTKVISDSAFYGCTKLTKIELSSGIENIGSHAFSNCDGLTSIAIPEKVKKISYLTFFDCNRLENITFPEKLKNIEAYAFWKCDKLKSIKLNPNLEVIGDDAFRDCFNLNSVTFADASKLTDIGSSVFENCVRIKSITLPLGVLNIFESTFAGCVSLEEINLPESIIAIADYAFARCIALPKVIIPSTTTIIGDFVFLDCSSLRNIEIPKDSKLTADLLVNNIGIDIFKGCTNFKSIIFNNRKDAWNSIRKNKEWNISCQQCVIHCIDGDIT